MPTTKKVDRAHLTLNLNPEISKELRIRAVQKYGNSRSLGQYIEDLTKETRGKV